MLVSRWRRGKEREREEERGLLHPDRNLIARYLFPLPYTASEISWPFLRRVTSVQMHRTSSSLLLLFLWDSFFRFFSLSLHRVFYKVPDTRNKWSEPWWIVCMSYAFSYSVTINLYAWQWNKNEERGNQRRVIESRDERERDRRSSDFHDPLTLRAFLFNCRVVVVVLERRYTVPSRPS